MSKNVYMKRLNENGEYEIMHPFTTPQQVENLFSEETKELIEVNTPDEAFQKMYLSTLLSGKALIKITVKDQNGTPLPNIKFNISGCDCVTKNGEVLSFNNYPQTNSSGQVSYFVNGTNPVFSLTNYCDIENFSRSIPVSLGEMYTGYEFTLKTRDFFVTTTSASYYYSPNVAKIQLSMCAGGDGGQGLNRVGRLPGGNGGGSYISESFVVPNYYYAYTATIGSGGRGGYYSKSEYYNPTVGGDTTFMNCTATHGINGTGGSSGTTGYTEASAGTNGTQYIFDSFTTKALCGGGGGGGWTANAFVEGTHSGGSGGSPCGGNGGSLRMFYYSDGEDGTAYYGGSNGKSYGGGGGGGTNSMWQNENSGGNGGPGCIAIRLYLKTNGYS